MSEKLAQISIDQDGNFYEEPVEKNQSLLDPKEKILQLENARASKQRQLIVIEGARKTIKDDIKFLDEKILEVMNEMDSPLLRGMTTWLKG